MTDTKLAPGTPAPDFELPGTVDEPVRLSSLRGAPVILAFYPADFSPVCGDQMSLYEVVRPEFEGLGANILGLSVDGVWCHRAFAEARSITYPLLSDFEPKGAVARSYGVYLPDDGTSDRALFVLDRDGVISWSYRAPPGVNPGADGILKALATMGGEGRTTS